MKKCLVIGGGFAGLTASAYLVTTGFNVELIESSPKLGGRAYSFLFKGTNTLIDNGQHIMMGCYHDTMSFLSMIGALDKVQVQDKLSVNFLKPGFDLHQLKSSSLPYPINLLSAIINYYAISFRERISILCLFLKLPFLSNRDLEKFSVDEFLISENQSENVKKAFWEILCVGALNTNPEKASAKMFVDVLKEIFLKGNTGSKIILPKVGLSEMFCEPAKRFIEQRGGRISLSERVEEIKVEKGSAVEVRTTNRRITNFDFIICAVPFYTLERIVKLAYHNRHSVPTLSGSECEFANNNERQMLKPVLPLSSQGRRVQHDNTPPTIHLSPPEADRQPRYSSILNVHVWLKENPFGNNFYALIGSKLHWVFSHNSYLTCVISDADYLMNLADYAIMNMIFSELKNYLNISKDEIINHFIVKEKRATFIPSNEILYNRPNSETEVKNLFLAGDWVNTGLPSTIESAVKSGRQTAELIKSVTF